MKKLTALALVATLGMAVPALAQTPADIKNFRDGTSMSATAPNSSTTNVAPVDTKSSTTKKSVKHSSKKSHKHSSKTHSGKTKTSTKTETKEETTTTTDKK